MGDIRRNDAVTCVNDGSKANGHGVRRVTWDRSAHDDDMVSIEGFSSPFNRVRDVGCNIAPNFKQDLLEHRGVQSGAGNPDFIEAVGLGYRRFREFNPFSSGQTSTHHKSDFTTVALEMNDHLPKLTHPHGSCLGFLWSEKTTSEGHHMNGAHEGFATRASFHPIPNETLRWLVRE